MKLLDINANVYAMQTKIFIMTQYDCVLNPEGNDSYEWLGKKIFSFDPREEIVRYFSLRSRFVRSCAVLGQILNEFKILYERGTKP